MYGLKVVRIASDPDIATEQINDAIKAVGTGWVEAIYPDTILIHYGTEYSVSDKYKLLRVASDPDIATDQINDAIKALGEVSIEDIHGIYPDTVMISYNPGEVDYRVKVVRIASDPKIATEQLDEVIAEIYKEHGENVESIDAYVLYSDTLILAYELNS